MKAIKLIVGSVIVLALSGCIDNPVKEPSTDMVRAADYGPAPTRNQYESRIKEHQNLYDPYSAVWDFRAPRKAYYYRKRPALSSAPIVPIYGWVIKVGVNAKNRFGGYTGQSWYYYFVKGDKLTYLFYNPYNGGVYQIGFAEVVWRWAEK